jgi:hypothetical protein
VTKLVRATLQAVEIGQHGVRELAPPFEVQLNPSSLQLRRETKVGSNPGERAAQVTGSELTLSVELLFDTADEGTTEEPLDVRTRSAQIATFVTPGIEGDLKSAPPSARFAWGPIVVQGVVSGFSEDLDLFAADGVPLRSRVSLTITEQDPQVMKLPTSPSPSRRRAGDPADGDLPALPNRSAFALDGETPAQLAARLGLEPEAWRAVAAASSGPGGAFAPGARIDYADTAGARPPARAAAPVVARDEVGGALSGRATDRRAAALALAAAGGVAAAAAAQTAERVTTAVLAAGRAFGDDVRTPDGDDARATTYGRGVPLRGRVEAGPAAPPPRAARGGCGCGSGIGCGCGGCGGHGCGCGG